MNPNHFLLGLVCIFGMSFLPLTTWGQNETQSTQTLTTFDEPLMFTYGAWEGKARVADGKLDLQAEGLTNQGGGGSNFELDLADRSDLSPALKLRVSSANQTRELRLMLQDASGNKATWRFELPRQTDGPVLLLPHDAAGLDQPNKTDEKNTGPIDVALLTQWQLIGDWKGNKPLAVVVEAIELVEPDLEMLNQRQARQDREEMAHREAQSKIDEAFAGIHHSPNSPNIVHVAPVDRHILEITIHDGDLVLSAPETYRPHESDEIEWKGSNVLVWENGNLVERQENRMVHRVVDGQRREVGRLVGGRDGDPMFLAHEKRVGDKLEMLTVRSPSSYEVRSRDDPHYTSWTQPIAVYQKTKPRNRVMPTSEQVLTHRIYLELPHALQPGSSYEIRFPGINTRQASVDYIHTPDAVRTSAIHTSHIGYRPDDPYKRGFLSIWLGTGGAHAYQDIDAFYLLDAEGNRVFQGPIQKVLGIEDVENLRPPVNLSHTAIYALDFSDYTTPGEVRIEVPGIGVSHPILISDDAWLDAFKVSMHGFLTQRSGIELGPPFTTFKRPRDLHPADGFVVFKSTTSLEEAYQKGKHKSWFDALTAGKTEKQLPGAWGGYHDAGDFDRSINHLWATYLHLELLDLFPEYFENVSLALPPDENNDDLPDLFNEALWNLELFRRLQEPDGGVSGGLEAAAHPRSGEPSHLDSLAWFAYAPDVVSTYTYAAVAARAARLLARYDSERADTYQKSALNAWNWAEANLDHAREGGYQAFKLADARNVAAAELLSLTGGPRFDQAFQETTQANDPESVFIEQQGGAFMYARLPQGIGNTQLKRRIIESFQNQADKALQYGDDNAFGLTVEIRDMPLIGPVGAFSVPGMHSRILPRTHYLTGQRRYLGGVVRSANFSAGANPDNRAMTTGIGFDPPMAPLHMDSRYTAQQPPAGLTLYGPYEHESLPSFTEASEWVHTWFLVQTMTPASRSWPSTESYVDFMLWPMMNELTIKQSLGPTSYTWGYLAAREKSDAD